MTPLVRTFAAEGLAFIVDLALVYDVVSDQRASLSESNRRADFSRCSKIISIAFFHAREAKVASEKLASYLDLLVEPERVELSPSRLVKEFRAVLNRRM